MTPPPRGPFERVLGAFWDRVTEFSGLAGDASYLWPRWIILRGVGLVYIVMFCSTMAESGPLLGPDGIAPIRDVFANLAKQYPNPLEAFLRTPSLFWISTSPGMIAGLEWLGLVAAVAVVLNLWPRLSLLACWLIFLSFANSGPFFSVTAPDSLMLEMALLCIPFAPAGWWPGLGASAAPRPVAVLALRLMLLRLMLEAGLSKFVYGSPEWRNLTAMDLMYESAPFPTVLAYWDHQLPHIFHVLEIALTFVAEIIAPVIMIFGRRPARWIAFWAWVIFQAGIELTNNFGWLQPASLVLGLVLLDDQMLVAAFRRLRLPQVATFLGARVMTVSFRPARLWALWALRVALAAQFLLALFYYVVAPTRIPIESVPAVFSRPLILLSAGFRSANNFPLFGNIETARYEVEFLGSNDGGETWRSYDSRYQAQRTDRMGPFITPWYPRLDALLENKLTTSPDPWLYQAVATRLLRADPAVLDLFRRNPFPDRPATMLRMAVYHLTFTDAKTFRTTGDYWHKEYKGEFAAMLVLDEHGEIGTQE